MYRAKGEEMVRRGCGVVFEMFSLNLDDARAESNFIASLLYTADWYCPSMLVLHYDHMEHAYARWDMRRGGTSMKDQDYSVILL
jgi:hypothetical protein